MARGRGEEQESGEVGESGEHRLKGGCNKREKVLIPNVATDVRPENTTGWNVQEALSRVVGWKLPCRGAEGDVGVRERLQGL